MSADQVRPVDGGVLIAASGAEPSLAAIAPWWRPDAELFTVVVRFRRQSMAFSVGDRMLSAAELGDLLAARPEWGRRPVFLVADEMLAGWVVQELADLLRVAVVAGPQDQGRWYALLPRRVDGSRRQVIALGDSYPFPPELLARLRWAEPTQPDAPVDPGVVEAPAPSAVVPVEAPPPEPARSGASLTLEEKLSGQPVPAQSSAAPVPVAIPAPRAPVAGSTNPGKDKFAKMVVDDLPPQVPAQLVDELVAAFDNAAGALFRTACSTVPPDRQAVHSASLEEVVKEFNLVRPAAGHEGVDRKQFFFLLVAYQRLRLLLRRMQRPSLALDAPAANPPAPGARTAASQQQPEPPGRDRLQDVLRGLV